MAWHSSASRATPESTGSVRSVSRTEVGDCARASEARARTTGCGLRASSQSSLGAKRAVSVSASASMRLKSCCLCARSTSCAKTSADRVWFWRTAAVVSAIRCRLAACSAFNDVPASTTRSSSAASSLLNSQSARASYEWALWLRALLLLAACALLAVGGDCKAPTINLRVSERKPSQTLATRAPKSSIITLNFNSPAIPYGRKLFRPHRCTIPRKDNDGEPFSKDEG